ncbi:MAG: hypothetical protein CBB77_07575 [Hyphomonas sp. TMED17]|nr:MAG: hypothetical protein CBB77_07575 [Hyphomonas sp. TMED17]
MDSTIIFAGTIETVAQAVSKNELNIKIQYLLILIVIIDIQNDRAFHPPLIQLLKNSSIPFIVKYFTIPEFEMNKGSQCSNYTHL